MDTCVSNFRQLFALNFSYYNYAYDLMECGRYYMQFHQLMAFWQDALGEQLLQVDYEALIAEPEQNIRRVLDFVGEPWHEACLNFQNNRAPVATASAVQVRQPLHANAIGRWRHYGAQVEPLFQYLQQQGAFDAPH